jgi:hypothetical protein
MFGIQASQQSGNNNDNSPLFFADASTTDALPTNTYSSGVITASANGALPAQDEVELEVGSILFVNNEVSKLKQGLYEVTDLGSVSTPFILTRPTNYNQTAEIYPSQVSILGGAVNVGKFFLETTVDPVIGTDPIVYVSTPAQPEINYPVKFVDVHTEAVLPNSPTYANGSNAAFPAQGATYTATTNGAFPTLQGVTPFVNMVVLAKDQVDAKKNGDYKLVKLGNASAKWKLRRIGYSNGTLYPHVWEVKAGTSKGQLFQQDTKTLVNATIGSVGNIVFTNFKGNMPSYTTTQRDAVVAPLNGTIVYNSTTGVMNAYAADAWGTIGAPALFTDAGAYTYLIATGDALQLGSSANINNYDHQLVMKTGATYGGIGLYNSSGFLGFNARSDAAGGYMQVNDGSEVGGFRAVGRTDLPTYSDNTQPFLVGVKIEIDDFSRLQVKETGGYNGISGYSSGGVRTLRLTAESSGSIMYLYNGSSVAGVQLSGRNGVINFFNNGQSVNVGISTDMGYGFGVTGTMGVTGRVSFTGLQTGNAGLASGDLYKDSAANILANGDLIVARKA